MSAKTVLRVDKIGLNGACSHNFRDYPDGKLADNIDVNRTQNNEILLGGKSKKEVLLAQEKRLIGVKGTKQKPPKNYKTGNQQELIKNIELDLSASAEYFFKNHNEKLYQSLVMKNKDDHEKIRNYWDKHLDQKKLNAWKEKTMEFIKEQFGDKCISAILHLDEKCPHIHIEVVPIIVDKFNKELLSCKRFYTPEQTLSWQDCYAQKLEPLGIQRGQEHSQSVHIHQNDFHKAQAVQRVLEQMKAPEVDLPRPITEEQVFINKKNLFGVQKKVQVMPTEDIIKNQKDRESGQKEKYEHYKDFHKKYSPLIAESLLAIEENKLLKEANATEKKYKNIYKKELEQMKTPEYLQSIRAIPLVEVLEKLGYEVKKESNNYYRVKTNELNLVINVEKNAFSQNKSTVNKYGAIDLLTDVFNYKFKEAVEFLGDNFNANAVAKTIMAKPQKALEHIEKQITDEKDLPPVAVPNNLPNIRSYLIDKRKIDFKLVDDLILNGKVYADKFNNCCFLNDKGNFASIRGTHPTKAFKKNTKEIDFIQYKNEENPEKVFLFESVIDLLSYRTLNPDVKGQFVSLNGNSMIGRIQELNLDKYKEIYCCFDNDGQGKVFTQKVQDNFYTKAVVKTITPVNKDFNDDLIIKINKNLSLSKKKDLGLGLG